MDAFSILTLKNDGSGFSDDDEVSEISSPRERAPSLKPNPSCWDKTDVLHWSRLLQLSPEIQGALMENEVTGPVLLTISNEELRDDLGVRSLAHRRFLLDATEKLRHQHITSDLSTGVELHERDIEDGAVDDVAVEFLYRELQQQQEIIANGAAARIFHRPLLDRQAYQDAELAAKLQEEYDGRRAQEASDQEYAHSIDPRTGLPRRNDRTGGQPDTRLGRPRNRART